MSGDNANAIAATANGSDRGARYGRLAELIERAAGNPASGLTTINHGEAQGAGVHATKFKNRVLITLIDDSQQSHVFILPRSVAQELCGRLLELRHPHSAKHASKAPVTKPNGRLL